MTSLHRSNDAILFLRKVKGEMRTLGGLTVAELPEHHHWLQQALHLDGYFTINSIWNGTGGTVKDGPLRFYRRTKKHVARLNACHVELDVRNHPGKPDLGFTPEECLERAFRLLDERGLPRPTLVVLSGNGVWLLWGFDEPVHVGAYGNERRLLERLNKTISQLFRNLGSDDHSTDCSRIMRVPGSVNTRANDRRVQFFRVEGAAYLPFQELLRTFNVPAEPTSLGPEDKPKKRYPLRANGAWARWARDLTRFEHVQEQRQGRFRQGTRYYAVRGLAYLMRMNGKPQAEIRHDCSRLAKSCEPPMDRPELNRCLQEARKMRFYVRHSTWAKWLKVPLEDWIRCNTEECLSLASTPTHQHSPNVTVRRNLVKELYRQGLSVRKIAETLSEQHQIRTSHMTVQRDLRALKKPPQTQQTFVSTAPVSNELAKSGCVTLGVRDFGELGSGWADANIIPWESWILAARGLRPTVGGTWRTT